jgi:hypothetical protein
MGPMKCDVANGVGCKAALWIFEQAAILRVALFQLMFNALKSVQGA